MKKKSTLIYYLVFLSLPGLYSADIEAGVWSWVKSFFTISASSSVEKKLAPDQTEIQQSRGPCSNQSYPDHMQGQHVSSSFSQWRWWNPFTWFVTCSAYEEEKRKRAVQSQLQIEEDVKKWAQEYEEARKARAQGRQQQEKDETQLLKLQQDSKEKEAFQKKLRNEEEGSEKLIKVRKALGQSTHYQEQLVAQGEESLKENTALRVENEHLQEKSRAYSRAICQKYKQVKSIRRDKDTLKEEFAKYSNDFAAKFRIMSNVIQAEIDRQQDHYQKNVIDQNEERASNSSDSDTMSFDDSGDSALSSQKSESSGGDGVETDETSSEDSAQRVDIIDQNIFASAAQCTDADLEKYHIKVETIDIPNNLLKNPYRYEKGYEMVCGSTMDGDDTSPIIIFSTHGTFSNTKSFALQSSSIGFNDESGEGDDDSEQKLDPGAEATKQKLGLNPGAEAANQLVKFLRHVTGKKVYHFAGEWSGALEDEYREEAGEVFAQWYLNQKKIDAGKIIVIGHSWGNAVNKYLMKRLYLETNKPVDYFISIASPCDRDPQTKYWNQNHDKGVVLDKDNTHTYPAYCAMQFYSWGDMTQFAGSLERTRTSERKYPWIISPDRKLYNIAFLYNGKPLQHVNIKTHVMRHLPLLISSIERDHCYNLNLVANVKERKDKEGKRLHIAHRLFNNKQHEIVDPYFHVGHTAAQREAYLKESCEKNSNDSKAFKKQYNKSINDKPGLLKRMKLLYKEGAGKER